VVVAAAVGVLGPATGAAAQTGPADASALTPPAARCPAGPGEPSKSTAYVLNGYRWDPAETVTWTFDTARVAKPQQKGRLADIKTAVAAVAKCSGLTFSYKGTETKLADPSTHRRLIQFEVSHLGHDGGVATDLYIFHDTDQMLGAVVDIQSSTTVGYGGFDRAHPLASPEGHLLLFGIGDAVGLGPVKTTEHEVMNPESSARFYATTYRAGDNYGLWKVGAAGGCGGFKH
jgi:hypothetical protein